MRERTLIEDHLKQMKELTDKLAAVGAPISEEDQVVTLLGSLPTSYSALVTALEARSGGDISLSYVQQALIHEKQKRNGQSYGSKGETALFGASNEFQYKKKVKCFNCKRFGHCIKNCPSLIKPDSSGTRFSRKRWNWRWSNCGCSWCWKCQGKNGLAKQRGKVCCTIWSFICTYKWNTAN